MKVQHPIMGLLLLIIVLFSCKESNVSPTEERMEENHPTESAAQPADTMQVIADSITDHNMKGQGDTHGRDVQKGD